MKRKVAFNSNLASNIKIVVATIFLAIAQLATAQSATSITPATFTNVAIAGSSTTWLNLGNVASSDNVYAGITPNSLSAGGQYTDYLQVTNFGFAIPITSVINGILVEIERADVNNAKDNAVRVVKGNVIQAADRSVTPAWSAEAYIGYGSTTDLWGTTWTAAEINSANFGAAFSCRKQGGGANPIPIVDHVRITIYFTSTLPIELLFFNAKPQDKTVQLSWETASELNNNYFTIERSADGIQFEELKTVAGAGNSSQNSSYTEMDLSPYQGISYYRLRQTDFNGQYSYSSVVAVNIDSPQTDLNVIYSADDPRNIFIHSNLDESIALISFYDAEGRLMDRQSVYLNSYRTTISLDNRLKGICLIVVETQGKTFTKRILIHSNS
jgi:hypothetical protein